MQTRADPAPKRLGNLGLSLLLLAVVLASYWPALGAGLLWDDQFHVTRPELRPWAGLVRIWTDLRATKQFYPVLHTAFWVEHRLWGDAALGYHLANVGLHAVSCCLLALVLRRLWTSGGGPGGQPMPAGADWLAAFVLAVHPVGVESVAWISEQKNTLSLVFYLLAAAVYLGFDRGRRPAAYAGASVLFVLALLTKSVTATLPAAVLVALWWRNGRLSPRRDVRPLLPWFVAAVADGLFTAWVERRYIGAEGPAFDLPPGARVLLAARAVWFYLGKLLWPSGLVFTYPRWNVASESSAWYGYAAALAAVTVLLWLLRRRTRGPLAGWLLFVGSLFPVLGFVNVYPFIFSYVADHFQYLATLGPFATAAGGVAILLGRSPPRLRAAGWALAAAMLASLAYESNRLCPVYHDSETLYRETLRRNPASWMAHNNLGQILVARGEVDAAIDHYRDALAVFPAFAGTHDNLGVALMSKGRVDEAIEQFQAAAALDPNDPMVHDNLGVAYRRKGSLPAALAQFELALAINPADVSARFNLGQALLKAGRVDEAAAHYRRILDLEPANAEALVRLGSLLFRSGKVDAAVDLFQRAVAAEPGNPDAENDLGAAYLQAGRMGDAIVCFQRALELRPRSVDAYDNLGNALLRSGRLDEAIAQFKKALDIDPDDPGTQQALRLALRRKDAAR